MCLTPYTSPTNSNSNYLWNRSSVSHHVGISSTTDLEHHELRLFTGLIVGSTTRKKKSNPWYSQILTLSCYIPKKTPW